ncbi:MAG: response regulator transcription factor [Oscillospiraceae bacterium]|nr:response regulator transcription factor [Oscillospiraceae bacterium]MBQ8979688.1 response regulator transcription factor [Oscillospiraceae bacterium]
MSVYLSSNGLTAIEYRPNVIVIDRRKKRDNDIQRMLTHEEMNVTTADHITSADGAHLLIIRDAGVSSPAFDAAAQVRSFSDIPILMLPDELDEIYTTIALAKGADMCADPRFTFELRARITALIRRSSGIMSRPHTLSNGVISIDMKSRSVYSGSTPVSMTAIEYGIVEYLLENLGDPCSIDDIYSGVWHERPYRVRKTIVEHIRRIRAKIEPDPHNPSYIKAVSGIGYKMEYAY